jgi:hypothetical protein
MLTHSAAFSLSQWQATDIAGLVSGFYQQGDNVKVAFYQQLQATVDGRYDFGHASLNGLVNVQPRSFRQWLSEQFTG